MKERGKEESWSRGTGAMLYTAMGPDGPEMEGGKGNAGVGRERPDNVDGEKRNGIDPENGGVTSSGVSGW